MTNFEYIKNLYDPEAGTTVTTDLEPAISIDHTNRLVNGIKTLQKALGITNMVPMAEGSVVKRYKTTYIGATTEAGEGEVIPLSKVTQVALDPIYLEIKKDRKLVTAEAIQRSGKNIAINETDEKCADAARKKIKDAFFATIKGATGTAKGGANLQAACAQAWGALQVYYEDMDVTPVFFVNPLDVATYLAGAGISTQNAFGFSYVENFLGLGNAFITTGVEEGKVYATATQNLNGVYIPANGALGSVFGLTTDVSGLVGMVHTLASDCLSLETVLVHGVTFYAEDESGIFVSEITSNETDSSSEEPDTP